jgi:hypothetical protein
VRLQQDLASSYLKVNRDGRVDSVSFVFGCGLARPAIGSLRGLRPDRGCEVPR